MPALVHRCIVMIIHKYKGGLAPLLRMGGPRPYGYYYYGDLHPLGVDLIHRYPGTQIHGYTKTSGTLMPWYTSTLVYQYTGTPVQKHTGTPIYRYTSTPIA